MATDPFVMLELEWWDDRSGRELALAAVLATADDVVPETWHVYNADVLDVRPGDWGCEFSLYLSARSDTPAEVVDEIRSAGIRVKYAQTIPTEVARVDAETLWSWLISDASTVAA